MNTEKDDLIDIGTKKAFKYFHEHYIMTETDLYRFIDSALFLGRTKLIKYLFKLGCNKYLVKALYELYPDYSYDDVEVLKIYLKYSPNDSKSYIEHVFTSFT